MAGLPSRAGERCAVEQRHRTMTTCHQGRARNASALRPTQAAQPDGRAGCVAAKPPFSTASGGGSVHDQPARLRAVCRRGGSLRACVQHGDLSRCAWTGCPLRGPTHRPLPALGRVGERASSTPKAVGLLVTNIPPAPAGSVTIEKAARNGDKSELARLPRCHHGADRTKEKRLV